MPSGGFQIPVRLSSLLPVMVQILLITPKGTGAFLEVQDHYCLLTIRRVITTRLTLIHPCREGVPFGEPKLVFALGGTIN